MEQAFIDFSEKVKAGGLLVSKFDLKRTKDFKTKKNLTYSLQNQNADVYAGNIRMVNGGYWFDVIVTGRKIEQVELNIGGMHNVENAVAAIAVVSSLEIDDDKIRSAVKNFRGVKRRFEYIIKNDKIIYIDDYAHHPEELRALVTGAESLFSDRWCTVIFQPHLYTRTRDLADGFAEVLDMADEIILLPIYPARELPIEAVSSEMILNKMKNKNKAVKTKEELMSWIKNEYLKNSNKEKKVLITAGAGDIDMLVEPIMQLIK
jgi:UDP-N-acetylmuramate--alanine ligase